MNREKTKPLMTKKYETPEALRHDARSLAEDAHALLEVTADITDKKVAAARERLSAALEHGQEAYAHLQERALRGAKVVDQAVHKHPYPTVFAAVGLGALIGFILARRS